MTPDATRVEVAERQGRVVVVAGGWHFRVQVLERGHGHAWVALVPTSALLLAGDHVRLDVRVGAGCHLVVTEPAGTVAYGMDGETASWDVVVDVAAGGTLVWHAPDFVVSQEAHVERSTRVTLAPDARCLLRETLVLGRSGERPGLLSATLDVRRAGVPVLVESLRTGPAELVPGVLGRTRAIDQVLELTADAVAEGAAMALESGGVLHRTLGEESHAVSLDVTWERVARALAGSTV